jgi:hypothetical protein
LGLVYSLGPDGNPGGDDNQEEDDSPALDGVDLDYDEGLGVLLVLEH